MRDVPSGFSSFSAAPGSRTAGEILAHVGDLLDWGLSIAKGDQKWEPRAPQDWAADVKAYDRVEREILEMSEMLADGLVAQFPSRFA